MLWSFFVQEKKPGVPWIMCQPVSMPMAFIISVRGEDLAHAAAIKSRADMRNQLCTNTVGFLGDALRRFGSDQGLVLFKRV